MHRKIHLEHNEDIGGNDERGLLENGDFYEKKRLLLVLLCVAFLISCGKDTEPDEAKGELVRTEQEGYPMVLFLFY